MKNSAMTGRVRDVTDLDNSLADRRLAGVMAERGLTSFVLSDGCYYPIVRTLEESSDGAVFSVLDPYTNYATETRLLYTPRPSADPAHPSQNQQVRLPDRVKVYESRDVG